MRIRLAIVVGFAIALLIALIGASRAADYPTVRELEAGIGYVPGSPLKELKIGGRSVLIVYVGAKALGHGFYDVRVKLR